MTLLFGIITATAIIATYYITTYKNVSQLLNVSIDKQVQIITMWAKRNSEVFGDEMPHIFMVDASIAEEIRKMVVEKMNERNMKQKEQI